MEDQMSFGAIRSVDMEETDTAARITAAVKSQLKNEEGYSRYIDAAKNKSYCSLKAKNFLVARIKQKRGSVIIEYKSKYDKYFEGVEIQHLNDGYSRIVMPSIDSVDSVAYSLGSVAVDMLSEGASGESFGCCGRFVACSDAGKCLHPDKLFAIACSYRRHLEAGRIFYGKNCNV